MPLSGPPPLQPPTLPIVVRRAYRPAPAFEAGGRRSVRLASRAGQRIAAPCTGGVRFAGRVAGGPPVITVGCGAMGLRVTVGGVTQTIGRGAAVREGGSLGRALGHEIGLSVRRSGVGYVDPIPLLAAAGGRSAPPVAAAPRPDTRAPRAWRPAPAIHGLRTLQPALRAAPDVAPSADRWLGVGGLASAAAAIILWLALRARAMRGAVRAPLRARRAGRA